MPYSVYADFLPEALETTVHNGSVVISNGMTLEFEADHHQPVVYYLHNGEKIPVIVTFEGRNTLKLSLRGYTYSVDVLSERDRYFQRLLKSTATAASGTAKVVAPMPGLIKAVHGHNGQHVRKGDRLFILEAMKMENDIKAPQEGIVSGVQITSGTAVEKGLLLCMIEVKH